MVVSLAVLPGADCIVAEVDACDVPRSDAVVLADPTAPEAETDCTRVDVVRSGAVVLAPSVAALVLERGTATMVDAVQVLPGTDTELVGSTPVGTTLGAPGVGVAVGPGTITAVGAPEVGSADTSGAVEVDVVCSAVPTNTALPPLITNPALQLHRVSGTRRRPCSSYANALACSDTWHCDESKPNVCSEREHTIQCTSGSGY